MYKIMMHYTPLQKKKKQQQKTKIKLKKKRNTDETLQN